MKWEDVGKIIGKAAPLVGSLVGGPAGGALGAIVSSILGVENKPDAVIDALKADPDALVKLKQYEMQHEEKLRAMQLQDLQIRLNKESADLESVNKTIRAEMAQQDVYTKRWRPTLGYAVTFTWVITWVAIVYVIIFDTANAQKVLTALTNTTALWSVALAVLGVSVWKRSTDKAVMAGAMLPSAGDIVTRVKNKLIPPANEETLND